MTRPTPTALKVIRGTARPDRVNPAEPSPSTLEVGTKPPSWLKGPRRRRAWVDLSELLRDQRLLTVLDAPALAMLVDAYGDYLEASDLVQGIACGLCGLPMTTKQACTAPGEWLGEDEARVYIAQGHAAGGRYYSTRTETGSLMIRPHPAMAIRDKAWARVVAMLGRFGMDPSSRSKVTAGAGERDEMDELLEDFS